jgi:hypothetical protein
MKQKIILPNYNFLFANWFNSMSKYAFNIIHVKTLTSGSQLNVECKGPWGQESVFGCETHSHKWGRM